MEPGRIPRIANILLGAWVATTVLLWPHTAAQAWSTALSGVVVVIAAMAALVTTPRARYAAVAGGGWLVASCFILASSSVVTILNNAVAGTLILLLALVPVAETGRIASLRES